MSAQRQAYLAGGGIGPLAVAAFTMCDADIPSQDITIHEAGAVAGGRLDGAGDAAAGYSLRGGRMLANGNYRRTWDLCTSIPSPIHPGKPAPEETVEFNQKHTAPAGSKNFAFVSQFVEIAEDTVFTVEHSIRAAQTAVYQLLSVERSLPPVTPHAKSLQTQFDALIKSFK